MNKSRFTINITDIFTYIYITWGLWYVFFNASLTLRPFYNILWPGIVLLGLLLQGNRVLSLIKESLSTSCGIYVLFIIVCLLSTMLSTNTESSIDYIERFVLALGFAFVSVSFNRNDIVLKIMRTFCLIMLVFSFLQYITPAFYQSSIFPLVSQKDSLVVYSALRSNEALGLTNGTSQNGLFMTMGFVLYSSKWINAKKRNLIYGILALVFFGMIFATAKRNYSVCAIIIFILLMFYSVPKEQRSFRWFRIIVGILAVFALFILASNYIPALSNVLQKTLNLRDQGDISNGRLQLYAQAWSAFRDNMWLGVGVDAASDLIGEAVHNSYLQWLLEFGIILIPIPLMAISYVPIINRKRIVKLISEQAGSNYNGNVLTYYLFMIMILISGFLAVPFQWSNVFMLYMMCQFMTLNEIKHVNRNIS